MLNQLPSVASLIRRFFARRAIGRDVSITIFTASSLNSGEKLFFGRGNYFTFPDGPSYWVGCPEGSGHPNCLVFRPEGLPVRSIEYRRGGRLWCVRGGGWASAFAAARVGAAAPGVARRGVAA